MDMQIIASQRFDRLTTPLSRDQSMNRQMSETWIGSPLAPTRQPANVVILDKLVWLQEPYAAAILRERSAQFLSCAVIPTAALMKERVC
ncbi:hypothetical protein NOVOSPHI9U_260025 [Novosphingobium sp. 9U]|nr:hypothetical protein NOVOSPHI9U_260025 [Novosphingobium sp. 9U]